VAGLLGAPIAWTHHWVWCVPITAVLYRASGRLVTPVLIFWSFALFFMPHTAASVLRFPFWKISMTNWYVVFGLAFTALAGYSAWAAARPATKQAAQGLPAIPRSR
jgi:alpha-1,2-mannosyltransferase